MSKSNSQRRREAKALAEGRVGLIYECKQEREAIYSQIGQFILFRRAAKTTGSSAGFEAAIEWAREMLRNVEATYREVRNRDDLMRVLGMEQTLVQLLGVAYDQVVAPGEFDYNKVAVPTLGQQPEG